MPRKEQKKDESKPETKPADKKKTRQKAKAPALKKKKSTAPSQDKSKIIEEPPKEPILDHKEEKSDASDIKDIAKEAAKKAFSEQEKTKESLQHEKQAEEAPGKDIPIQPEINIELVGHVDHGKTTLTEALTGKWTDTHSEELKRGITIRLGYADAIFYKYPDGSYGPTPEDKSGKGVAVRKVSFVDAPGHESLMATMLAGMTIIDGALLLVAANEVCPQPQTREHLMALQIAGVKKVIVVQNKIDLVSKERAVRNYEQIKEFLKNTEYKDAPIIPISAQHKVNIDVLIETIEKIMKTPPRNPDENPLMFIARSFDINKPGTDISKLNGGVLGGSVIKGMLKVGDIVEIRPGRIVEEQNQLVAKPLTTKITSAMTGGHLVDELTPGGSVAVQTLLDPAVVKSDKLSGNCVGIPGKLPEIRYDISLDVHLLDRVVGSEEEIQVQPIKKLEPLMLNVNSAATLGVVTDLHKKIVNCKLKMPVCAENGSRVTISRRIGTRFRLIGFGIIK